MHESLINKTFGPYKLIREVGRGGMGILFLAEHEELKQLFALKVLRPDLGQEKQFVRWFNREARVMAALRHENIVRVLNVGFENNFHYLVMDYIEGPCGQPFTLADRLREAAKRKQNGFTEQEVRRITIQMCEALEYAHTFETRLSDGRKFRCVVHRDLKPANVLIDKKGSIKITDFGLATILGEDSIVSQVQESLATDETEYTEDGSLAGDETGGFIGTYDFMSPEQKRGCKIDHRSDIYSLGLIIYQLLTGEKPGPNYRDPSDMVPGIPKTWDIIVWHCLQDCPSSRFASAADIINLLNTKTQDFRRKTVIAIIAGLVCAGIVGGIRYCDQDRHQQAVMVGATSPLSAEVQSVARPEQPLIDIDHTQRNERTDSKAGNEIPLDQNVDPSKVPDKTVVTNADQPPAVASVQKIAAESALVYITPPAADPDDRLELNGKIIERFSAEAIKVQRLVLPKEMSLESFLERSSGSNLVITGKATMDLAEQGTAYGQDYVRYSGNLSLRCFNPDTGMVVFDIVVEDKMGTGSRDRSAMETLQLNLTDKMFSKLKTLQFDGRPVLYALKNMLNEGM